MIQVGVMLQKARHTQTHTPPQLCLIIAVVCLLTFPADNINVLILFSHTRVFCVSLSLHNLCRVPPSVSPVESSTALFLYTHTIILILQYSGNDSSGCFFDQIFMRQTHSEWKVLQINGWIVKHMVHFSFMTRSVIDSFISFSGSASHWSIEQCFL